MKYKVRFKLFLYILNACSSKSKVSFVPCTCIPRSASQYLESSSLDLMLPLGVEIAAVYDATFLLCTVFDQTYKYKKIVINKYFIFWRIQLLIKYGLYIIQKFWFIGHGI